MSIEQMRAFILAYYPSEGFKARVAKMKDQQIAAIYFRIIRGGK